MRNRNGIILLLLLLAISQLLFSQDKLKRSRDGIAAGAKRGERQERRHSGGGSVHNLHEGSLEYMLFSGVARAFMFVTYQAAIGNYQAEDHLHRNLTSYPYYEEGQAGNYEGPGATSEVVKKFRIDLSDQYLYGNENTYGNHFKLKLRPFQYFYFQTDYFLLKEKGLPVATYSDLSLFNFNLCYDRIRLERFNLGWTLGFTYIGGDVKESGVSYGFNAELFVAKNFSLNGAAKWSLVNNAPVDQFEMQAKYHLQRCFFSVGYEHLKIATPTYDFVSVGGGIYL